MIEIQHLKKQFSESTPLVDVNVTINKGDVIAVIGPSGTGKSTLLRCINLLEKPTSGHIILDGEDITSRKCNINRVRTKVGMVFQSFNLYEHLTVVENCMLAQTVLLKRSRQQAYDKAMELLASVGMDAKALQYPSQLSGGQKQRVAIARTLSTDPEIILFDEPTSALDPLTVAEVESVIADLSKQGRTMMIVTHSMDFARKVSNRVFYMDQGGIYEDGTPEQIFDHSTKDLTRKFIRRLASIQIEGKESAKEISAETAKIYKFCRDKGLSDTRSLRACSFYEEYCSIMYHYAFGEKKEMLMSLEYNESDDSLKYYVRLASALKWVDIEEKVTATEEYKVLIGITKSYVKEPNAMGYGTGLYHIFEIA